jgi:hypothetical protein
VKIKNSIAITDTNLYFELTLLALFIAVVTKIVIIALIICEE